MFDENEKIRLESIIEDKNDEIEELKEEIESLEEKICNCFSELEDIAFYTKEAKRRLG